MFCTVATLRMTTNMLRIRKRRKAALSLKTVLLWSRSMSRNLGWTNKR